VCCVCGVWCVCVCGVCGVCVWFVCVCGVCVVCVCVVCLCQRTGRCNVLQRYLPSLAIEFCDQKHTAMLNSMSKPHTTHMQLSNNLNFECVALDAILICSEAL